MQVAPDFKAERALVDLARQDPAGLPTAPTAPAALVGCRMASPVPSSATDYRASRVDRVMTPNATAYHRIMASNMSALDALDAEHRAMLVRAADAVRQLAPALETADRMRSELAQAFEAGDRMKEEMSVLQRALERATRSAVDPSSQIHNFVMRVAQPSEHIRAEMDAFARADELATGKIGAIVDENELIRKQLRPTLDVIARAKGQLDIIDPARGKIMRDIQAAADMFSQTVGNFHMMKSDVIIDAAKLMQQVVRSIETSPLLAASAAVIDVSSKIHRDFQATADVLDKAARAIQPIGSDALITIHTLLQQVAGPFETVLPAPKDVAAWCAEVADTPEAAAQWEDFIEQVQRAPTPILQKSEPATASAQHAVMPANGPIAVDGSLVLQRLEAIEAAVARANELIASLPEHRKRTGRQIASFVIVNLVLNWVSAVIPVPDLVRLVICYAMILTLGISEPTLPPVPREFLNPPALSLPLPPDCSVVDRTGKTVERGCW